jgi:hypothetical protein
MDIPVVTSPTTVVVSGATEEIELSVDVGSEGKRGSKIFTGTVNPTGLDVTNPIFGGVSQFQVGDMYVQKGLEGDASYGQAEIFYYNAGIETVDWQNLVAFPYGSPYVYRDSGDPNGRFTAPLGSIYQNSLGGVQESFWIKESEPTPDTGWSPLTYADDDHRASTGASHSFIDQDVSTTSAPILDATNFTNVGGVWQDWTPTLTGFVLGAGIVSTRYTQIGKTVSFEFSIKFANDTYISGGTPTFTLPIAPANTATNKYFPAFYNDITNTGYWPGSVEVVGVDAEFSTWWAGANLVEVNGSSPLNSSTPFTWATGDYLEVRGTYESV